MYKDQAIDENEAKSIVGGVAHYSTIPNSEADSEHSVAVDTGLLQLYGRNVKTEAINDFKKLKIKSNLPS